MRILPIVIALLVVAIPAGALAKPKPKIAVAPLKGDAGNKIGDAVVDALAGKDFVVVGPKEVSREAKLDASDELGRREVRRLAKELEVVAVIDGKVSKPGKKRSLRLEVHRPGKASVGFTIQFRSATSAGFRRAVKEQILVKLDSEGARDPDDEDDGAKQLAEDSDRKRKLADDEASATRARQRDDDDRKRKLADDDDRKRKADDDGRPRKRASDDRDARRKRVADDEPAVRKRRSARRGAAAASLARVGAGASVAQRQLTYDTRSGFTQVPPRVLTTAGAGRVDGEIYPFALADPASKLAAFGLAGSYDKTFGLAIKIPNQAVSAPISQSHYAIGARYRFAVGEASTITLGLDYARRQYVADRSGLMALVLDCPDVDYTAVAPGVSARVPVTPTIAVFGGLDGLLMLETGPIQQTTSYGPASVYGIEALAGVDIHVANQLGLRIALEYSRIKLAFNAKGTMSTSRDNDAATQDINSAADRSIGVAATLGLVY